LHAALRQCAAAMSLSPQEMLRLLSIAVMDAAADHRAWASFDQHSTIGGILRRILEAAGHQCHHNKQTRRELFASVFNLNGHFSHLFGLPTTRHATAGPFVAAPCVACMTWGGVPAPILPAPCQNGSRPTNSLQTPIK